ncbi:TPA: hypothetical protein ENS27_06210 [bacterium]|nr:hypothetical protein [bacterium]
MSTIKEQLLNEIEILPDESLKELLDFAEYLHKMKEGKGVMDEDNPLLRFIGGVSLGSLAEGIDEELYGMKNN